MTVFCNWHSYRGRPPFLNMVVLKFLDGIKVLWKYHILKGNSLHISQDDMFLQLNSS